MESTARLIMEIVRAQAAGKLTAYFHNEFTTVTLHPQDSQTDEKARKLCDYILKNFDVSVCTMHRDAYTSTITLSIHHNRL